MVINRACNLQYTIFVCGLNFSQSRPVFLKECWNNLEPTHAFHARECSTSFHHNYITLTENHIIEHAAQVGHCMQKNLVKQHGLLGLYSCYSMVRVSDQSYRGHSFNSFLEL